MATILIVDNSSLIRLVADKAAREVGHDTVLAENGKKGLDVLKKNRVDLIFSNINMPIMDGLRMVENIKENPNHKWIPIIMLVTELSPMLKEQGKALGIKDWLLKPFNKNKFILAVTQLLDDDNKTEN